MLLQVSSDEYTAVCYYWFSIACVVKITVVCGESGYRGPNNSIVIFAIYTPSCIYFAINHMPCHNNNISLSVIPFTYFVLCQADLI